MKNISKRQLTRTIFFFGLIFSLVLAASAAAYGVVACPHPQLFTQPDGSIITLQTKGDEFLGWTEDSGGNLIVFDLKQNGFCYATWTDDGPVSTGELLAAPRALLMPALAPPHRTQGRDIPHRLRDKARREREEATMALSAGAIMPEDLVLLPNTPPVTAPAAQLKRRVLIIHVTWSSRNGIGPAKLNGSQIYDLVFNPATNSVNKYYREILGASEDIILPASVNNPLNGAAGVIEVTLNGPHTNPGNNKDLSIALMKNAVTAACSQNLVNLRDFDTNGNGRLEAGELSIGLIIDGYEAAANGPAPAFWGMTVSAAGDTPDASATNNVKIERYFGQGAFHRNNGSVLNDMLTVGVICHELGHAAYGFKDTYDTGTLTGGNAAEGHGFWSLMAYGGWAKKTAAEYNGAAPSYPDAYNLVKCGFVTPGLAGDAENISLSSHLSIYIVRTDATQRQYFLLQQRKFGLTDNYDRGAFFSISPSANTDRGGLLIYHIDENAPNNNKPGHMLAGIAEAHGGVLNLQQTAANRNKGDLADLWGPSQREFSYSSDPSSNLYGPFTNDLLAPDKTVRSGVTINNIVWNSGAGATTLTMGYKAPTCYITSFSIPGSVGPAVIDQTAGTIGVLMPFGASLTSLTPTIQHNGLSVAPPSNAAQNFTNPVLYTVTAANGDTNRYTVSVRIATVADGLSLSDIYQPAGTNLTNSLRRYMYYGKYNAGADKPRPWFVIGQEDGALVLMQRYAHEQRDFHTPRSTTLLWGQSNIYNYLNNIGGQANPFTAAFVAGELSSVQKTEVKTIAFDQGDQTYSQQEDHSSYNTSFYLPSFNSRAGEVLSVTWSATLVGDTNKLIPGFIRELNGDIDRYWMRSILYGLDEKENPYFRMPYTLGGTGAARNYSDSIYWVRPLFKLNPANIVFIAEIGGSSIGSMPADANYEAGLGADKSYKLTVLGGNNGAAVGTLSNVPSGTVTAGLTGHTLSGLVSSPSSGGVYSLNYKIVREVAGTRSIVGYGSSSSLSSLNIDTGELMIGENYTVYVWLQKNNAVQSHEATMPQHFSLTVAEAQAGVNVSGLVKTYNPTKPTNLVLQGTNNTYPATIAGESGAGQREQGFNFSGVEPGTYTLIITKDAHTKFTVHNIVVAGRDVDLTQDGRPDVRLMTLRCGDINGDGNINNSDLTIMWQQANYNRSTSAAANKLCDLNGDGFINNIDLTILWLAYNYNRGEIEIN
jgi:M6 family metalloprotease-like protein